MQTEGFDSAWGWKGPVGELIKEAAIAGAYRAAIRKDVVRTGAFAALADRHSAKVAALARGIGAAGLLLESAGFTNATA